MAPGTDLPVVSVLDGERHADAVGRSVVPRGLVGLLGAAALVVVAAGLRSAAWSIGPAFLIDRRDHQEAPG